MDSQIRSLKDQNRSLKDQLEQKQREIDGLKKIYEDTSEWMEEDNTDREKLVSENENLKSQLENLTEKYKKWMENEDLEKDKLKAEIKILREKCGHLDENMNYQQLQDKLDETVKENVALHEKLQESVGILEQANIQHDQLQQQIQELQNEKNAKTEYENDKITFEKQELKRQKLKLEKEFQEKNLILQKVQNELKTLNETNIELKRVNQALESEVQAGVEIYNRFNSIQRVNNGLKNANNKLLDDQKAKNERIEKLEAENEQLKRSKELSGVQIVQDDIIEKLKAENEALKSSKITTYQVEEILKELNESEVKVKNLTEENLKQSAKNDIIEELKAENEALKSSKITTFQVEEILKELSEHKAEIQSLNEDNLKLQSELFAKDSIAIDDSEVLKLRQEVKDLHVVVTKLRLREERVNSDKNECQDILSLNEKLNENIDINEARIVALQDLNAVLEDKLQVLQHDLETKEKLKKKYKMLKRQFCDNVSPNKRQKC